MSAWMFRRLSRGTSLKKLPWINGESPGSTSNEEDRCYSSSSVDSYGGHSSEGTFDGAHAFADGRILNEEDDSESASSFEEHQYLHNRGEIFDREFPHSGSRQRVRTPEFPSSSRNSSIDSVAAKTSGNSAQPMKALCKLIKNLNHRLVSQENDAGAGSRAAEPTEENEAEMMLQSLVHLFTTMQNDRKNFLNELHSLRTQLKLISAESTASSAGGRAANNDRASNDRASIASSSCADDMLGTPWLAAPPPPRRAEPPALTPASTFPGALLTNAVEPDFAEIDAVVDQITQKFTAKRATTSAQRRQMIREEIEQLKAQVDLIKGEVVTAAAESEQPF